VIKKLTIPPGLKDESTSLAAGPSWHSVSNVRFRGGYAESIGGWTDSGTETTYQGVASDMLGAARGVFTWSDYSSRRLGCVGTNWKFYAIGGLTAVDVTPIRSTISAGTTVQFTPVNESDELIVNHTDHGAVVGDFVTFGGSATMSGNISAAMINQEHQIISVTGPNAYKVKLTVSANSTDAGGAPKGGSSVTASYQVNVGQPDQVMSGWGEGFWDGSGLGWDYALALSVITDEIRQVFMDNYNEDLIICSRGGPLYYYDVSANINSNTGLPETGVNNRAQSLDSFSGSAQVPTKVDSFLVSERDGHCIGFGCNDINADTQNSLLVRWSDQNNPFDWEPTAVNTAGGQMLRVGSKIVCAVATKSEILIFTNSALYSMRFIGPPDVFAFNLISQNVNILGRKVAVNVAGSIFYMGMDGFYVYSGAVQPVPSPVAKMVFEDLNLDQKEKSFAGSNSSYNEVYWFYPSKYSMECDKFVIFNYSENTWSSGSFDMSMVGENASATGFNRTSWEDIGSRSFPSATYISEYDRNTVPMTIKSALALHELEPAESNPFASCGSHVETGDIDISEGDAFTLLSRVIPDLEVTKLKDDALVQIYIDVNCRDFPTALDSSFTQSSTVSIVDEGKDGFGVTGTSSYIGNNTSVRLRGRTIRVKFYNTTGMTSYLWRLGEIRLDAKPDGRR
jgi:hypothetical protein